MFVISVPEVKLSLLVVAPHVPVFPLILHTTCADIQGIRSVCAPTRRRNYLPAPDKSLLYSMDSTLVSVCVCMCVCMYVYASVCVCVCVLAHMYQVTCMHAHLC